MVIDSSAMLAYFQNEPGAEVVDKLITQGGVLLSSVNLVEIKGKLVGSGLATPEIVDRALVNLQRLLRVAPFDTAQANTAAFYYARRKPYNLSLGDCACFALAENEGAKIITAEKSWKSISGWKSKIMLIR